MHKMFMLVFVKECAHLRQAALSTLFVESKGHSLINTIGCRRMEVIALPTGMNGQQVIENGQIIGGG